MSGPEMYRNYILFLYLNFLERVKPLDKLITEDTVPPLCLPTTAQVVRLVPGSTVPRNDGQTMEEDEDNGQFRARSLLGYLEVTDVARRWVSTLSNSYFIQIATQRRLFCRHFFNDLFFFCNTFLPHFLDLFATFHSQTVAIWLYTRD